MGSYNENLPLYKTVPDFSSSLWRECGGTIDSFINSLTSMSVIQEELKKNLKGNTVIFLLNESGLEVYSNRSGKLLVTDVEGAAFEYSLSKVIGDNPKLKAIFLPLNQDSDKLSFNSVKTYINQEREIYLLLSEESNMIGTVYKNPNALKSAKYITGNSAIIVCNRIYKHKEENMMWYLNLKGYLHIIFIKQSPTRGKNPKMDRYVIEDKVLSKDGSGFKHYRNWAFTYGLDNALAYLNSLEGKDIIK